MSKRLIILLGLIMGLVLLSLITVQINWIRSAYIVKEKQFDQMVHQALSEVANVITREETYNLIIDEFYPTYAILNALNQSSTDPHISSNQNKPKNTFDYQTKKYIEERQQYINSVLTRMFSYTPEIEERITGNEIEAILNETLFDYGIDIGYQYAVSKRNNNIAFQSKNFNPNHTLSIYRVRLYPEDFAAQSNYLDIYFPERRNFIFRSLGFMGISSGILTVLIVFTFAFTLWIIFKQKRVSEIKNDFVNNMTHELKTPISTISLASQMLGDNTIPSESRNINRISEIITQESKRLGYQVEKVLQIAVIDKGNLELKLEIIDIHDLIESVAGNFIIQVDLKGGLLIPSLHAEKSIVNVDPVHMTNVLSNLLDNAIKYTPHTPEIYIETRSNDDFVSISVKDNGIGIHKANQKKVFERFYRVPTGNVHNVKGFGLGLNYVKKIVEEHNGTIEVESEPEKGTTFTFKLPTYTERT